jgi:hypothetical protein
MTLLSLPPVVCRRRVHDSDYFIEVTVVNKAMLETVLIEKVST